MMKWILCIPPNPALCCILSSSISSTVLHFLSIEMTDVPRTRCVRCVENMLQTTVSSARVFITVLHMQSPEARLQQRILVFSGGLKRQDAEKLRDERVRIHCVLVHIYTNVTASSTQNLRISCVGRLLSYSSHTKP